MIALAALLLAAAPPSCPAAPPFTGFERASPLAAAPARRTAPLPRIALDRAAAVTLAPTRTLVLETPSETAARPDSYGGLLELAVPLSGTYRIALSGRAWIDLAIHGKTVASVAHAHGPACGPVAKIVDFALAPGTYTLQISDAAVPALTVMAVPAR